MTRANEAHHRKQLFQHHQASAPPNEALPREGASKYSKSNRLADLPHALKAQGINTVDTLGAAPGMPAGIGAITLAAAMPASVSRPACSSPTQVSGPGTCSKCAGQHNRRVPAARAQGSGAGIDAVAAPGAAAGADTGTAASKGSPVRPEILSLMPRGRPQGVLDVLLQACV